MTEPTPTSSRPERNLTDEQVCILTFLKAYPHASAEEIAWHIPASNGTALDVPASHGKALDLLSGLLTMGYVAHSGRRAEGWVPVAWMFDPDSPHFIYPMKRGTVVNMADGSSPDEAEQGRIPE
jgi:hypothetical protein